MATIKTDDGEIEVSADQIQFGDDENPSGFVPQPKVDDIVSQRVQRAKESAKESALEDDDFFQRAASKRGIELREDGRPKGSLKDDEIQNLRQKASKVDSLSKENEKLSKEINSSRESRLEAELLKAGDVDDSMEDAYLTYAKSQMTYDSEYGWVQKGEDGIKYEAGEPVTARQAAQNILESKPGFRGAKPANAGPDTKAGGSGSKKHYTEEEWTSKMQNAASLSDDEYKKLTDAYAEGRVG